MVAKPPLRTAVCVHTCTLTCLCVHTQTPGYWLLANERSGQAWLLPCKLCRVRVNPFVQILEAWLQASMAGLGENS